MRRLHVLLASFVIATLLLAVASGASAAPGPYKNDGALYFSPSLQSSYFVSATHVHWANQGAHYKCQQAATDCKPGVWVTNGYAAFAVDPNGAMGTSWGHTSSLAVQGAKTSCQTFGGVTCDAIVRWYRTIKYSPESPTYGGIPSVPRPLTEALPPAVTGLGMGSTGQDR